jgi:hypothetical protein
MARPSATDVEGMFAAGCTETRALEALRRMFGNASNYLAVCSLDHRKGIWISL